jgi:hypothetical protein
MRIRDGKKSDPQHCFNPRLTDELVKTATKYSVEELPCWLQLLTPPHTDKHQATEAEQTEKNHLF